MSISTRRPLLSDEAAEYVRDRITAGQLTGGDVIRPEAVAAELGISATPAREGLLLLQSQGFVRLAPRRGFTVQPLTSKDIADAFEAQALLAGELTARATGRACATDIERLAATQEQLEQASARHDFAEVEQFNFEFHRTLYRLADAPKISMLLGIAVRYAPRRFYATIEGWPQASIDEHIGILDALRAADAEAARAAMAGHIREAGRLLSAHMAAALREQDD